MTEILTETETPARAGGRNTPGFAYVREFLPKSDPGTTDFIAESLDTGVLLACPACHFVRLPRRPFAWDFHTAAEKAGLPDTACDVCAAVHDIRIGSQETDLLTLIDNARHDVCDERRMRAETLYRLWMSATTGADALVWAAMAEGLSALPLGLLSPHIEAGPR